MICYIFPSMYFQGNVVNLFQGQVHDLKSVKLFSWLKMSKYDWMHEHNANTNKTSLWKYLILGGGCKCSVRYDSHTFRCNFWWKIWKRNNCWAQRVCHKNWNFRTRGCRSGKITKLVVTEIIDSSSPIIKKNYWST